MSTAKSNEANTGAQASQQMPEPNPALKDLEVLVGDWDMELSRASFLPDPSATVKGFATVEWLQEGAFLVIRQGDYAHPPFSTWVVGRDAASELYKMLYYDDRGVSRIYDMSFKVGVWKIWRDDPAFRQRFTGAFGNNGKSISAEWEKSSDGETWEHDFDVTYTKRS